MKCTQNLNLVTLSHKPQFHTNKILVAKRTSSAMLMIHTHKTSNPDMVKTAATKTLKALLNTIPIHTNLMLMPTNTIPNLTTNLLFRSTTPI